MIENKPSTVTENADNGKAASVEADLKPAGPIPLDPVSTANAPAKKALLEDFKAGTTWPPPLYLPDSAGVDEQYYLRYRWQSQWLWYDGKASENKLKHQLLQVVIGVGSVSVPVLLGQASPLREMAVWVSLIVAAAAAIENVKKYGDNWRSYRQAAEDLSREKSLYNVAAGPYKAAKRPFARFVERCEDVIAQQNGRFYQRPEDQQAQPQAQPSTADSDTTSGAG